MTTPTPRTDAVTHAIGPDGFAEPSHDGRWVHAAHARQLEMELEESRNRAVAVILERDRWRAKAEEKIALRREIEAALNIQTGDTNDDALAKGIAAIRALQTELAQAQASVENYATAAEELRQEVNNLRGQLAKAEADTKLLDGLERMMPPRAVMLSSPQTWKEITGPNVYVHVYEKCDLKRGDYVVAKTMREAIAKAVEKWGRQ